MSSLWYSRAWHANNNNQNNNYEFECSGIRQIPKGFVDAFCADFAFVICGLSMMDACNANKTTIMFGVMNKMVLRHRHFARSRCRNSNNVGCDHEHSIRSISLALDNGGWNSTRNHNR